MAININGKPLYSITANDFSRNHDKSHNGLNEIANGKRVTNMNVTMQSHVSRKR